MTTSHETASPTETDHWKRDTVAQVGIGLLIFGLIFAMVIFCTLGIILLLVGLALAISSRSGDNAAGRNHW